VRWLVLLGILMSGYAFAESISGKVVGVIDGDTLVVQDASGKRYTVRLAEIDAPEPRQPFWLESSRSLAALCFRKSAQVEWSERDRRKRYLGYVSCAGVNANEQQVRRGMAWTSPQATKPSSALYEMETYARLRRIGLWADDRAVAPWEWRAKEQ
jgi:endonuclease YncB( thermonuclease family)